MNIAYIRVSTVEQNEARQLEGLKKYDIDKIFKEKVSAKDTNRLQLKAMLEFAREGDIIYVWDFSRLARSTKDLLNIVEQLEDKKIHLKSIKENLDTSTPTGKLMLTTIGAINEFERANLLERQKEKFKEIYNDKDYVFANEIGEYILPDTLRKSFVKVLEDNNLRHISFHGLRHSYATRLFEKGVSLKIIQKLLGHSSLEITADIYTHIINGEKISAVQKLNDLFKL
ncbi:MAG: recombinase family protein [Clostridium butyricum]|nr:recombinase family protein [Clostridium butyricum]MDU4855418.1 recombinase family protein [Clostridioides difficile]